MQLTKTCTEIKKLTHNNEVQNPKADDNKKTMFEHIAMSRCSCKRMFASFELPKN